MIIEAMLKRLDEMFVECQEDETLDEPQSVRGVINTIKWMLKGGLEAEKDIEARLARLEGAMFECTNCGNIQKIKPEAEKPLLAEDWPYPKATLKQVTKDWYKACQEREAFRDELVAIEDIAEGDGSPSERLNKIREVLDNHLRKSMGEGT